METGKKAADAYRKQARAKKKAAPPATGPSAAPPAGEAGRLPDGLIRTVGEKSFRKVAKFLLIIGRDRSAEVLRHFNEQEIEKISAEIATIKRISPDESQAILRDFGFIKEKADTRPVGGVETARRMLVEAFGEAKGREFLYRSLPHEVIKVFGFLNDFDPRQIHRLLAEEPAGAISLILPHIEPAKAAAVIELFENPTRTDIVKRMASRRRVNADVLAKIEEVLREKIRRAALPGGDDQGLDGTSALAEILKYSDLAFEREVLKSLEEESPELAEELKERLLSVDSIETMEDRDLQKVLHDLGERDIALMLKGKTDGLRSKMLANVSERRRALIADEYKYLGPVSRRDVDAATRDFLLRLKKLEEEGEIVFHRKDNPLVE